MTRRRWLILAGIGILIVAAVSFAALNLSGQPANSEQNSASPSPTGPIQASEPTSRPSQAELAQLRQALGTADTGALTPFVPLGRTEQLSPAFTDKLKALGLSLEEASLKEETPGVWTTEAVDRSAKRWEIGLVRVDGQLKMLYAEEAL